MNEWPLLPFSQLLKEPVRNGIYKPKKYHGSGAKIVNMGELFGHPRLRIIPMKRLELTSSESDRFLLEKGDLLFARRSLTAEGAGKCSVVLEVDGNTTFESSIIRARPDQSVASSLYLYYFFKSPQGRHLLDTIKRHVAVAGITGTDLSSLKIPVPIVSKQHAIASILGALDDKIDCNRRMNESLEAMARAMFKDWFVDFGPTKAKMEGRAPYLAPEIWDLFPDRLDDEGKPEGWEFWTVGELAEHRKGSVTPSKTPEALFEHYSLPAYDAGLNPVFDLGATIKSNKTPVAEGAVLLSKLNPNIPRVWVPAPVGELPQVTSTEFLVFVPNPVFGRALLTALFKDSQFRQKLGGMVTGTSKSHQRVSPNSVLGLEALAGSPEAFSAGEAILSPFLEKSLANREESNTLAQTRDLLLPKFMSGEIRVRDAERAVEDVL